MLTIKTAASLLASADSLDTMLPIAHLLGFTGEVTRLRGAARRDLGIASYASQARLVPGSGAICCLLARLAPPAAVGPTYDARERTRLLAVQLVKRSPTRHWCVLAIDHDGHLLTLATVTDSPHGPRIAALRLDRRRVLDSDADTVRALAAVTDDDPLLRHARFTDILRRDALTHRFYRALEQSVTALGDSLSLADTPRRPGRPPASPLAMERRELALLAASRLLFLAFIEAKGWLNGQRDFLMQHALRVLEANGSLHEALLRPLFFGTLNTPRSRRAPVARAFGAVPFLNGGLFTPTPLEKRFTRYRFSNDALTGLVTGVLDRYRFTAREDSASWSEAAVDPEMLGRAFESLMAAEERRRSGSFYTPPHLVAQAVREALLSAIPELPTALLDDQPDVRPLPAALAARLRPQLEALRVLDPACGSGAFLVHVLERIDAALAACGDVREAHVRRREVLTRSVFGVDRQPMAVWLCELRLWLSVVIECAEPDVARLAPLPNLDHHIRVGDSLAGGAFDFAPPSPARLTALRARYVRASGARKATLASELDREERQRALAELDRRRSAVYAEREALLLSLRGRDLFGERRRASAADRAQLALLRLSVRALALQRRALALGGALPFRYAAMFADVAARGGFTLVVGNPPWVRPHAMPVAERVWLRQEFRTMRDATWRDGARGAGAGAGFAGQADLAVAFIERAVQLLAPNGTLALLVPAKLWRTLSGGGVRRLLLRDAQLRALHDWSDAPAQFDAATYPSLVVATRRAPVERLALAEWAAAPSEGSAVLTTTTGSAQEMTIRISITRTHTTRFSTSAPALSLGGEAGAPWVLLPAPAQAAFETLRRTGVPLAQSVMGRPLLGVKCGYNAAFLVRAVEHDDDTATVMTDDPARPRQGVIERTLLRPVLRGEEVGHWFLDHEVTTSGSAQTLRIIWTHNSAGEVLRTLPPATARWMAQWKPGLSSRSDIRHRQPWWTLFRTEAARSDAVRIVWADIGRKLRSRVLLPGDPTVPLNSCYVVRAPHPNDAYALHALLRSTIASAWLDVLAEPARGGFRRFLGWTVAALPVPRDWASAVRLLAPAGRALSRDDHRQLEAQTNALLDLDELVALAYGIPVNELLPLLEWYVHA
ncbi:MAG: N-6 DNA methylase [Gemmatimonadaceae bacterium]|nr:N-6 DNA methylase [Gemmatimonadaceae bacterium]